MHIEFFEIGNYRKLKLVHIDVSTESTIFVGANNSGKTSAMVCLSQFLIHYKDGLDINDFTISCIPTIIKIGLAWEELYANDAPPPEDISEWSDILPFIDVWLNVERNEIHHASHLLPSLDWEGGIVGVRLQFEPKNILELFEAYTSSRTEAQKITEVKLWPKNLYDFLIKKLNTYFLIRAYVLDPDKYSRPKNGAITPQPLSKNAEPLDSNPFKGLIRIDKIDAHRGLSNLSESGKLSANSRGKLSEQLQAYYKDHLDPTDAPDPKDISALKAVNEAEGEFNEKLHDSFSDRFNELSKLGYPGITDPQLSIKTKLTPIEGLSHPSALQYKVLDKGEESLLLPEHYNGLGYQNLISMAFKLMSFRDAWMREGKANKRQQNRLEDSNRIEPLHLVLIEEPEAHLHVQVEQVFIRKSYSILRNHKDLQNNTKLHSQLILSTHSSDITHECDFSTLRYFRRERASTHDEISTADVINLSDMFGNLDATQRFVKRYLKSTHCDLFFADAAILVEGTAERILLPHFIQNEFPNLTQNYLTILEIGGSHAHKLRPLIEKLRLTTVIITDIDAMDTDSKSKQPERDSQLFTRNMSLKEWTPKIKSLDELLDLDHAKRITKVTPSFSIYAAYQCPIIVEFKGNSEEAISNTFEDSLVYQNIEFFSNISGKTTGLLKKFNKIIKDSKDFKELAANVYAALKDGEKAEFALDLLDIEELEKLSPPKYIHDSLKWLDEELNLSSEKEAGLGV